MNVEHPAMNIIKKMIVEHHKEKKTEMLWTYDKEKQYKTASARRKNKWETWERKEDHELIGQTT